MAIYDVFIDLTNCKVDRQGLDKYLDQLARDAGWAGVAGCVTVASGSLSEPPATRRGLDVDLDAREPAAVLLARAIRRATALRRHLVVLVGPIAPGNEVLADLVEAMCADPMFGTSQPRFADTCTDLIWPFPGSSDSEWAGSRTSRSALPFLPRITITPELLAACTVIRWEALAAVDAVDAAEQGYGDVRGTLLHILCQTRRRGMRNIVVNRLVVPTDLTYRAVYPMVTSEDLDRLRTQYPDTDLAEAEISELSQRRLEPLLAATHRPAAQRRILLDCRGMGPYHNGSSQVVIGFLDGFASVDWPGHVDVLVSRDAAKFHRLSKRYAGLRQQFDWPTGEYFAAVGLTQPWALSTVAGLHRHALVTAFVMLDTIAWDVLYPTGAGGLAPVWRFIARYADALLYNSHFTRDRFRTRFPLDPGVAEQVTLHSLRQEEHVDPSVQNEPLSNDIVVFGNEYDHKDLRPTVRLLVDAFPFNRIVAFGTAEALAPNVVAIPSGKIEDAELHRLIATARVIVYPSYYEGFGLPVVEGLAYGRPVLVRRSPLWAEIAGWSRLPGALIEYDDAASLVERVGRVLSGLPTPTLPSGVHIGADASPVGWKDYAGRVIDLLNSRIADADGTRWSEREEALRLAGY